MITTDSFNVFGRRIASTVGCPYAVIAVTPNPIRQLEPDAIHARVAAMLPSIVDGLTLPPAEILLRTRDQVRSEIRPAGIVRSSTPV
jgi:hypothetical protein